MGLRAVLTYHSVDRSGSAVSVTPEAFRAHVAWLATGAVPVVTLAELLALPEGANAVAITFDDALASVATEAAPLLSAHGLPATVFVVSGHVGSTNQWGGRRDPGTPVQSVLGWEALARLQTQGFCIGAHSRTHPRLSRCTPGQLADEVAGSAHDIATALGERPVTFAYPYGALNSAVAEVAAAQFDIACTTAFQPVRSDTRRELVPRLDAWYFKDATRLSRWGSLGFTRSLAFRDALRRLRQFAS